MPPEPTSASGMAGPTIRELRDGPPCTRCGHVVAEHTISPSAAVQDPADERARRICRVHGCECANYEKWTRP